MKNVGMPGGSLQDSDCLFVYKEERRALLGIPDPTWDRLERRGEAPRRRQVSPGRVAWLRSELIEFAQSRPVVVVGSGKVIGAKAEGGIAA